MAKQKENQGIMEDSTATSTTSSSSETGIIREENKAEGTQCLVSPPKVEEKGEEQCLPCPSDEGKEEESTAAAATINAETAAKLKE